MFRIPFPASSGLFLGSISRPLSSHPFPSCTQYSELQSSSSEWGSPCRSCGSKKHFLRWHSVLFSRLWPFSIQKQRQTKLLIFKVAQHYVATPGCQGLYSCPYACNERKNVLRQFFDVSCVNIFTLFWDTVYHISVWWEGSWRGARLPAHHSAVVLEGKLCVGEGWA